MSYDWTDIPGAQPLRPGAVVVSSFPSAGLATTVAAHFMVRSLKLPRTGFFQSPEVVPVAVVQGGEVQPPIRAYTSEGLALVLSEFPPSPGQAGSIARGIFEGARRRKASLIVCLEGVVPHPGDSDTPPPEAAATQEGSWVAFSHPTPELEQRFLKPPSRRLADGVIGGVTGALLVMAIAAEIPVVAVLVSARPTEGYPDDRAGAHLIERFTAAFPEFQIDTGPLRAQAEEIERMLRTSIRQAPQPAVADTPPPASDMYR
jgi:predicted ATP-grasp superfamily ATP-dependent carboligase